MSGATKWRRPTGALAVIIGLVLLGLALFSGPAQANTSSVTDPTGDVVVTGTQTPASEPRADIIAASMSNDGTGTITATLNVQQFDNPTTSANWKNGQPTQIVWALGNGGVPSFQIEYVGTPNGPVVRVRDLGPSNKPLVTCPNTSAGSSNSTYSASVPASCVGSPSSFHWATSITYDPRPSNTNATATVSDHAPNSGAGGPVVPGTPTTTTIAPTTTTAATTPSTSSSTTTSTSTTVFIPGASNASPSGFLTPSTVSAGGPVGITSSGWFPNASVTVTLHSDPVVLGTFSTDSSGRLSVTVVIPGTTAAGAHTLDLTGVGADGVGHDVALALTVTGPVTPANSTFTPVVGSSAKVKGLSVTGRSVRTEVAIGIWFVILGLALLRAKAPRRFRFGNPLR